MERRAGVEGEKMIVGRWQTEMKVDIDEVADRCDLLLVQLLPEPEAAQLVTRQQGGVSKR